MYIRVKEDKLRDKERSTSLRFEVIQSYRDQVSQRPKSRLIVYLGSIRQTDLNKAPKQELFWRKVDLRLGRLSLSLLDEQNIRNNLRKRVPRPACWNEILSSFLSNSIV
jgi:hypothetical protein